MSPETQGLLLSFVFAVCVAVHGEPPLLDSKLLHTHIVLVGLGILSTEEASNGFGVAPEVVDHRTLH